MKSVSSIILLVTIASMSFVEGQPHNTIRIASASDLKFALDSILSVFDGADAENISITYGSSGKLFVQISNGAPFDLFFSADIGYPRKLQANGLTRSEIYSYGIGRIVLWSKKLDPRREGMSSLRNSSIKKVAIANPTHAPYGQRASESLEHFKLLDAIQKKLVYGENISQTAQFVAIGAADIGIVALSLALSPGMQHDGGNYFLIPEESHSRLEQGVVLTLRGSKNSLARSFLDFIKTEQAVAILRYFGFTKP